MTGVEKIRTNERPERAAEDNLVSGYKVGTLTASGRVGGAFFGLPATTQEIGARNTVIDTPDCQLRIVVQRAKSVAVPVFGSRRDG
jgi:hypothetical protein